MYLFKTLVAHSIEILFKRTALVKQYIEIMLADHQRHYPLGKLKRTATLEHSSVMVQFSPVIESGNYKQSQIAKTQLLKIKILDHERGEIVSRHLE